MHLFNICRYCSLLPRAQSSLTISCDCLHLALGPETILGLRHVINSYVTCWQSVSAGTSPREAETKAETLQKVIQTEKTYYEQDFTDDLKRGGFIFVTDSSNGKCRMFHLYLEMTDDALCLA